MNTLAVRISAATAKHETGLVIGLTVLGAALRLFQLGSQSLWLDELFSVAAARGDLAQVISAAALGDFNPPLSHLLIHIALLFGSDETAARIVPCLFSIATIPVFYLTARQLFDRPVAVLATLILALNPFQVLFAQEARMYAQLAFFALVAQLGFWRAWQGGRSRDWALFVGATVATFYTHNLAALNLLAIDGFALWQWRRPQAAWRRLIMSHVLIGLCFVPWLPYLLQQVERVRAGFWGSTPTVLNLFTTPYLFLFGNAVPLPLIPVALFAGLALMAFGLAAVARRVRSGQPDAASLALVISTFLVPMLLLYLASLIRPMFVERTLIASSFGIYLLVAWTVMRAPPRALNVVLGTLIWLPVLGALPAYYFDPAVQKPHMREVARSLEDQIEPGDLIVNTSDSSALAFSYYAPSLPSFFLAGDPDYEWGTTRASRGRYMGLDPKTLDELVDNHTRLWLVVLLDHNQDYQEQRVAELDGRYGRAGEQTVVGIQVLLYNVRASAYVTPF